MRANVTIARVVVLMLACVCASTARADEGDQAATERLKTLRQDLRSEKPATVAHAAYSAGEESLTALAPDLIKVLAERPKPENREGWLVVKHILDALIRLDAKVPMKTLARYEDDIRTSVLILAVRNGKAAYPLLRKTLGRSVKRQEIAAAGVVAGNVLVAARDERVAALFLSHIEPVVSITVKDHDRLALGGGAGSAFGHGDGWCNVPEDFPPYVWYELTFRPFHGRTVASTLLVRGPVEDVYYQRWVNPRKRFIIGFLSDDGDVTDIAMGWAASLLGTDIKGLPIQKRYYGYHQWSDAKAYLAFVNGKRREVQEGVETLTERLMRAGLLTKGERAAVTITPRLKIKDRRHDKSVPLPDVE